MGFNEFISKLFGNKSTRDMREIQPWVEKVKAVYEEMASLSNDDLRAKTEELKARVLASAEQEKAEIAALKSKVEDTELEDREALFNQIDKKEKDVLEIYEKAQAKVLTAISNDPLIKTSGINKVTNLSESRVNVIIKQLKEMNMISRVGSKKTGYWEVL